MTFEYVPGTPVLKNVSLNVRAGSTVAVVGNSGGGKTTLVNLLPRFYDVKSGAVKIDGQDIRSLTMESLRDKIAVVFQDNFLFEGTIRDNITLGKENASDEEIAAALKMAYLDDFVAGLENGVDTEIGERGALLSGGQRQRLAIARAFIKNAPIVILDEATSALDNKSEAVVQKAIDNLMQDRTVLLLPIACLPFRTPTKSSSLTMDRLLKKARMTNCWPSTMAPIRRCITPSSRKSGLKTAMKPLCQMVLFISDILCFDKI